MVSPKVQKHWKIIQSISIQVGWNNGLFALISQYSKLYSVCLI